MRSSLDLAPLLKTGPSQQLPPNLDITHFLTNPGPKSQVSSLLSQVSQAGIPYYLHPMNSTASFHSSMSEFNDVYIHPYMNGVCRFIRIGLVHSSLVAALLQARFVYSYCCRGYCVNFVSDYAVLTCWVSEWSTRFS